MSHVQITRESKIPLVGCLYFGIVDRGTNVLQVRPSCSCNLNCPFCSVDAGPLSSTRTTTYAVERAYLVEDLQEVAEFKGPGVECHIDSPGEPLLYPEIVDLVQDLRSIREVSVISMQTNGTLLDATRIGALEEAGLDRINLSMHALSPDLARRLAGFRRYDIEQVKDVARWIAESRIDLLIAPVYLPGINDAEIPRLIAFAQEIGAGKRWPPLGIQKFERYRWGRTPRGIEVQNWWRFFNRSLRTWEKEYNSKLLLKPEDFGIERRKALPVVFEKGERATVDIRLPGWLKGEMLGVGRERVVSLLNCPVERGSARVQIVSNKHNIYVGMPI